jgi:hypothetical protein
MDPASDFHSNQHNGRQAAAPEQRAARTVRAVAIHLAQLIWPAVVYLGSTALDLIYAVRVGLLRRSRARSPDRVGDLDAQMARLREQRSRRWSSWKTLPGGRRIEIRFAAAVLALAAILGLWAYLTRGESSVERVAQHPKRAYATSAPRPRSGVSTPTTISAADQALLDAEHFRAMQKQAAPGQWIVYGVVESVESASARLAEAQAQIKTEAASLPALSNKHKESMAKLSSDGARRESLQRQHASQAEYHELEQITKADQAVEQAASAAQREARDRIWAAQSAEAEARAALNRTRHLVVRPVLTRGEVNQWDGFTVTSPVVIKDGNRYRMWYVGCHFVDEDYSTCGVGHAQSNDGITWEKSPGPVLALEDPVVGQDLHSIAVVRTAEEYLLWYALDSNAIHGNDCATLNFATSKNGLDWKPQGLVLSANCQLPGHLWQSAFSDGKTLHLWYTDHDSSDNGSLVHLVSLDGKKWQQAGATDMSTLAADFGRLWVMSDPSGYRALFTAPRIAGNFGMLHSPDGNSWVIAGDPPKLEEDAQPKRSALFGSGSVGVPEAPVAIIESGGTWIWFAVPNTRDGSEEISVAFQKEAQK